MTLIDRFNFFFNLSKSKIIKPSSQLVYLHYLHFWNLGLRKNSFYCSDREVAKSTGLSLHSITEAKGVLKNFGLLDWRIINGRTKIFLPEGERYTVENTVSMQIERNGDKFIVSEDKLNFKEKEKEQAGEAVRNFRNCPANKIDVEKNLANAKALREKIQPKISDEERERAKAKAAEFLKKFSAKVDISNKF